MPVCSDFCTDFWNACKNDHICFNEEELKEYVWDLFTEGLSEEKDYKVHHCEGNYKCQKLQDSIIARPIGMFLRIKIYKSRGLIFRDLGLFSTIKI